MHKSTIGMISIFFFQNLDTMPGLSPQKLNVQFLLCWVVYKAGLLPSQFLAPGGNIGKKKGVQRQQRK